MANGAFKELIKSGGLNLEQITDAIRLGGYNKDDVIYVLENKMLSYEVLIGFIKECFQKKIIPTFAGALRKAWYEQGKILCSKPGNYLQIAELVGYHSEFVDMFVRDQENGLSIKQKCELIHQTGDYYSEPLQSLIWFSDKELDKSSMVELVEFLKMFGEQKNYKLIEYVVGRKDFTKGDLFTIFPLTNQKDSVLRIVQKKITLDTADLKRLLELVEYQVWFAILYIPHVSDTKELMELTKNVFSKTTGDSIKDQEEKFFLAVLQTKKLSGAQIMEVLSLKDCCSKKLSLAVIESGALNEDQLISVSKKSLDPELTKKISEKINWSVLSKDELLEKVAQFTNYAAYPKIKAIETGKLTESEMVEMVSSESFDESIVFDAAFKTGQLKKDSIQKLYQDARNNLVRSDMIISLIDGGKVLVEGAIQLAGDIYFECTLVQKIISHYTFKEGVLIDFISKAIECHKTQSHMVEAITRTAINSGKLNSEDLLALVRINPATAMVWAVMKTGKLSGPELLELAKVPGTQKTVMDYLATA